MLHTLPFKLLISKELIGHVAQTSWWSESDLSKVQDGSKQAMGRRAVSCMKDEGISASQVHSLPS